MSNWTIEDVINLLEQDYCVHYRNKEKYLENNDEIDADYEDAQCDYIFNTLLKIIGTTPKGLDERLTNALNGIFTYDVDD